MSDYDWTPYLEPDEELLWTGAPATKLKLFALADDLFVIPFGLIWFVSMYFYLPVLVSGAEALKAPSLSVLHIIGICIAAPFAWRIVLGRAFRDRAIRQRTQYAITSSRVFRVDAVAKTVLSDKQITPVLKIDAIIKPLTTVMLDPYQKGGDIPYSQEPKLHWTLTTIPRPSWLSILGASNILDLLLNGYRELGLEQRLIHDGPEVVALLKTLKSEAPEGQVPC